MKQCIACNLIDVTFKGGRSKRCVKCEEDNKWPLCKICATNQSCKDRRVCQKCLNEIEKSRLNSDPEYKKKRQGISKKYFDSHKDVMHSRSTAYARTPRGRYKLALRIAKRRKLLWTISQEDYLQLILQPCFYCSNLLDKPVEAGIGLDRIDNSTGYTIENVLSCCGSCNSVRGDILTVEETRVAIDAVLELRNLKVLT